MFGSSLEVLFAFYTNLKKSWIQTKPSQTNWTFYTLLENRCVYLWVDFKHTLKKEIEVVVGSIRTFPWTLGDKEYTHDTTIISSANLFLNADLFSSYSCPSWFFWFWIPRSILPWRSRKIFPTEINPPSFFWSSVRFIWIKARVKLDIFSVILFLVLHCPKVILNIADIFYHYDNRGDDDDDGLWALYQTQQIWEWDCFVAATMTGGGRWYMVSCDWSMSLTWPIISRSCYKIFSLRIFVCRVTKKVSLPCCMLLSYPKNSMWCCGKWGTSGPIY